LLYIIFADLHLESAELLNWQKLTVLKYQPHRADPLSCRFMSDNKVSRMLIMVIAFLFSREIVLVFFCINPVK
jgi:hypothetical protein